MTSEGKQLQDGKGYTVSVEKLVDDSVQSHMNPFIKCVLEGQEAQILKLDQIARLLKSVPNLKAWMMGITVWVVIISTVLILHLTFM